MVAADGATSADRTRQPARPATTGTRFIALSSGSRAGANARQTGPFGRQAPSRVRRRNACRRRHPLPHAAAPARDALQGAGASDENARDAAVVIDSVPGGSFPELALIRPPKRLISVAVRLIVRQLRGVPKRLGWAADS